MCPMEKYINTNKNPTDAIRRLFKIGVSLSSSAASSAASVFAFLSAPFTDAPYPAASTAEIILVGSALPSTPIEFVNKLTEQEVTPGTLETAFSTLALQAAQLIPVTVYCSITFFNSSLFFISNLQFVIFTSLVFAK